LRLAAIDDDHIGMDRRMITPLPEFTPTELQALHKFCLKYRDLVRGGGKPTPEQDEKFMAFQKVCYAEGVAYER